MSMIRLTVEETNLLSIYNEGGKRALIENVNAALPYMVIRFRQTGQYLTLLEVDAKNAPHSVHFFLSPVW